MKRLTMGEVAEAMYPAPKAPTLTTKEAWIRHMQGLRPVAPKGALLSDAERGHVSPLAGLAKTAAERKAGMTDRDLIRKLYGGR
jgi:hypothetical protein